MNPTVGLGTLRRLSALDTGGRPVLSLYLDLTPPAARTPAARERMIDELVRGVGVALRAATIDANSANLGASVTLTRKLARAAAELAYASHGLAAFATVDGSAIEVIALPVRTQTMATLGTLPWLEPLAAMCSSPGDSDVGGGLPVRVPIARVQAHVPQVDHGADRVEVVCR